MAWETIVNATQITGLQASETAFQLSAADWKVELEPNEIAHLEIKGDVGATPVDHLTVSIYASALDAASTGAVPDSAQTLAGSSWSLFQRFRIVNSRDNEWVPVRIQGIRTFAVSVVAGATDSWTVDARLRIGVP